MPVDWKNPETVERLITAIFASYDAVPNWHAVAYYFGGTKDSVELKCRAYRQNAKKLKEEMGPFNKESVPKAVGTPRKRNTAQTPNGVLNGRITKSEQTPTPKKKVIGKEKADTILRALSDGCSDDEIPETA